LTELGPCGPGSRGRGDRRWGGGTFGVSAEVRKKRMKGEKETINYVRPKVTPSEEATAAREKRKGGGGEHRQTKVLES